MSGPRPTSDQAAADRSTLPSMAGRSQRARRLTLWGFAITVLVCALGLWWIAQLAWG
jgi:type VI protein secretion system component VasF